MATECWKHASHFLLSPVKNGLCSVAAEALRDPALGACGWTPGPGPLRSHPVLLSTLTAGGESRPLAPFPLLESSGTLVSMSCHPLLCKPPEGIQHYSRNTAIVTALLTVKRMKESKQEELLFFFPSCRTDCCSHKSPEWLTHGRGTWRSHRAGG